ncbi:hypothetical protein OH77DRAFT_877976 [Trametes cingulata]|nr:hypothetical protein OH77DRAFT_877976 [Trametes cingulata]
MSFLFPEGARPNVADVRLDRGFAYLQNEALRIEQHDRAMERLCAFCGKKSPDPLPKCSLCKSVHYCDVKCQSAHYKAGHKRECVEFVHPPATTAFMTKPLEGMQYARDPIFAHGHVEGMGCWVSSAGRIDGFLQHLTDELRLTEDPGTMERRHAAIGADLKTVKKHKAFLANLLSVAVLVQNRRKDGRAMTVYGARTQVVCFPDKVQEVMRGRVEGDRVATFEKAGHTFAAIGVAEDPWTKTPRVLVKNFNGMDMEDSTPLPAGVHDASRAIVTLQPGDYALLHMQFRLGDGSTHTRDWHAFALLHSLSVTFLPALASSSLPSSLSSLPTLPGVSPGSLDRSLAAEFGNGAPPSGPLRAPFDHAALRAHYADDVARGVYAHVESHYGTARAEMMRAMMALGEDAAGRMFGMLEEDGEMERVVGRMREAGLTEDR